MFLFAVSGHSATAVFPHLWSGYVRGLHTLPALLVLVGKLSLLAMACFLLLIPDRGKQKGGDSA